MKTYEVLRPMGDVKIGERVTDADLSDKGKLASFGGAVRLLELQSIRPVDEGADAEAEKATKRTKSA